MKFAVSLILATLTALSVSAQEAVDSVPLPPQSSRVWAEYGLATLEVGYEKNNSAPVYRKILIGVIGPSETSSDSHDAVQRCTLSSLKIAGDGLYRILDSYVQPFSNIELEIATEKQAITTQAILAKYTARTTVISQMFSVRVATFHRELRGCLRRFANLDTQFHLGTVVRICQPSGARPCSGPPFDSNPSSLSIYRFQKLYEWMKSDGFPAPNIWQQLVPEGKTVPEYDTPIELWGPDKMWPACPTEKIRMRQFEQSVIMHRARRQRFDYPVAAYVGLSKTNTLHILDAFDDPARSVADLTDEPKPIPSVHFESGTYLGTVAVIAKLTPSTAESPAFQSVSDEVARTRIEECARFRGPYDLPDGFNFPDLGSEKPRAFIISPKGIGSTPMQIPKSHLFIWGWVTYKDIFVGTPTHLSEFCVELASMKATKPDVSDPTADLTWLTATCKTHNCYDQDCSDYKERIK